jgi:hypothetical protein
MKQTAWTPTPIAGPGYVWETCNNTGPAGHLRWQIVAVFGPGFNTKVYAKA